MKHLRASRQISERRACSLVGLDRTVARYRSRRKERDKDLLARMRELAAEYRRYGYLRLHVLLRQEGLVLNRKRTYRVYRAEGLSLRKRLRKRLPQRERLPITVPDRPNRRWSLDFVSDQLWTGRRFRALCVVDDCTKESLAIYADFSISGLRLTFLLEALVRTRGAVREIVLDNGPELTSKAMFLWAQERLVQLRFIQPGKPVQNAFAESFIGRLRDECLNEHWFSNLIEARRVLEEWRWHYNERRPHSSLGYQTPAAYARGLTVAA